MNNLRQMMEDLRELHEKNDVSFIRLFTKGFYDNVKDKRTLMNKFHRNKIYWYDGVSGEFKVNYKGISINERCFWHTFECCETGIEMKLTPKEIEISICEYDNQVTRNFTLVDR